MSRFRTIDADALAELLDYRALVEALRGQFKEGCDAPVRHHHQIAVPGEPDATLLLMPAWQSGGVIGIKVATVFPGNGDRNLPGVMANYLLLSGRTGEPLALLEGKELTARRTACASALAADYLARENAKSLLMVGTGALAPHLVRAHATVRPIEQVHVWGRTPKKARALAERLRDDGIHAEQVTDLEPAVAETDIVSCATMAIDPLIQGGWLSAGQHVDLVGGFRPDMREADDAAIKRARVYVDTRAGAKKEAGDIAQPLLTGVLRETDILGDLYDLTRGIAKGRQTDEEITLFKSVGTALEDLAAAKLAVERLGR